MRGAIGALLGGLALLAGGPALAQGWSAEGGVGTGTASAVSCLPGEDGQETSMCLLLGCRTGEAPRLTLDLPGTALPDAMAVRIEVDGTLAAQLELRRDAEGTTHGAPLAEQAGLVEAMRGGRLAAIRVAGGEVRLDYELPLGGSRSAIDSTLAACASMGGAAAQGPLGPDPDLGRTSEDPEADAIALAMPECGIVGGSFAVEEGFARRQDVDGDGIADLLLDWGALRCDGLPQYCGTGGCTQEIWLGAEEGPWRLLLSDLLLAVEVTEPGHLSLLRDGGFCGLSGAEVCRDDYVVEDGLLVPLGGGPAQP